MIQFFQWLGESIVNVVENLINTAIAIIHMMNLIIQAMQLWLSSILNIPVWLYPYAFTTLMVSALYLIVGRGGNGGE